MLFRRDKGKALFVKADVEHDQEAHGHRAQDAREVHDRQGLARRSPTRFRLRVLSSKLSKAYTPAKLSPVIGPRSASGSDGNSGGAGVPTAPDGDCDADGVKNGVDLDDDNDLLGDALELSLVLDPCVGDTDGDGVEDGFEYQSADRPQQRRLPAPEPLAPVPGQDAVPEPAVQGRRRSTSTATAWTLQDEYKLWKYTYEVNGTATRTLAPLSYSDGAQYSLSALDERRRRARADDDGRPPTSRRRRSAPGPWRRGYATPMLFQVTHPLDPLPHVRVPTTCSTSTATA